MEHVWIDLVSGDTWWYDMVPKYSKYQRQVDPIPLDEALNLLIDGDVMMDVTASGPLNTGGHMVVTYRLDRSLPEPRLISNHVYLAEAPVPGTLAYPESSVARVVEII